jgi:hypothetical protein
VFPSFAASLTSSLPLRKQVLLGLGVPPEQPSDEGAVELRLVLEACYELDRLDVEDLSPARFILEHGLEQRLGVGVSLLQPDCDEYGKHEDNNEQNERGCPDQTLPPSPLRPWRIVARHVRWGEE